MINKVDKNIKYLNYLFIIFFALILLLRPYQFVIFDSEPDYLANAIHILQWNIPWGGHHPGTIFQYFFSIALKLSFFLNLNLDTTIILLRVICLILAALALFISSKLYLRENIKFFKYALTSILITPVIYWHISHFGIELILFSISFLVWSYLIKILNEQVSKKDFFIISFLIGITLSIKFSSILLLLVYLFLIFFNLNFSFNKKIVLSIITSIISFFTFFLITLPSVRYYPKLFNKINREINLEKLISDKIFIITFFIVISIFLIIFLLKNYSITKLSNRFKNEIYYIFFPIIFLIIIFSNVIQNFNLDTYNKVDSFYYIMGLFRNFMPILPIFIIALYKLNFRISYPVILIFTCINFFLFYTFFYNESRIDDIIKNENQNQIITFTSPNIRSKFVFLEYTKKRYGNGKITFPENWPHTQNFSVLESAFFFKWLDKKENNSNKKKLYDELNIEKTTLGKIRYLIKGLFKDKEYSEHKYDIFSLERPFYKQRIIQQNYCEKITNKIIIFDKQNKFNLSQLNKFEKKINKIIKNCDVKKVIKKISDEDYVKYTLEK